MISINIFCSSSFHSQSPNNASTRSIQFAKEKKIKTEPILYDIMENGKKNMVLYSIKVYPQSP